MSEYEPEKEREKLRAVQAVFEQAVKENNIGVMEQYVDENFSFVSFTDKSFDNFAAFQKQWNITREQMVGNGRFETQLNPDETIFVDDLAICKGNAQNFMVNKKKQEFNFTSHWTVILRRHGDEWRVLRAHNSLDPFASPMLKSAVKQLLIKSLLGAFALGALLSWLLTGM